MFDRSPNNSIIVENTKDGCILRVGEKVLKRSIGTAICAKINESGLKRNNGKLSIDLRSRTFGAEDVEKLKAFIQQRCDMKVSHIYSNTADIAAKKRRAALADQNSIVSFESKKTLYTRANVRCGQILEYDGSVILLGNLNAGGHIQAQQSVIVLGEMRGSVQAGLAKNCDSFIYAGSFKPVKASIGDVYITYSQIPEYLIGGSVICSAGDNEILLKGNFEPAPAKGCVLFAE